MRCLRLNSICNAGKSSLALNRGTTASVRNLVRKSNPCLSTLITCPRYPTFFLRRQKESSKEKGDFWPKASAGQKRLYAVDAVRSSPIWRFLIAPVIDTDSAAAIVSAVSRHSRHQSCHGPINTPSYAKQHHYYRQLWPILLLAGCHRHDSELLWDTSRVKGNFSSFVSFAGTLFALGRDTPRPKGSFPWSVALILFLVFTGCKSEYRYLKPAAGDVHCIEKFAPRFENTLYTAYIDVTKHHLSGLLFFKRMPDSSMRVVFTNEMGVKFFDFEFAKDGAFTKHYILSKLDKKVIVKALRNDMELVLLRPELRNAHVLQDSAFHYIVVPTAKGNNYYITDAGCDRLERIEKASKRKAVVTVNMVNYKVGVPDSIGITHNNFKFNIALKRTER